MSTTNNGNTFHDSLAEWEDEELKDAKLWEYKRQMTESDFEEKIRRLLHINSMKNKLRELEEASNL